MCACSEETEAPVVWKVRKIKISLYLLRQSNYLTKVLCTALDIILVCAGQLSIYAFSSLLAAPARAQAAATRHPWVWALGRIQATPAPGPPQDSKVQGSNFDIDTGVKTYLENVGFSAFFLPDSA